MWSEFLIFDTELRDALCYRSSYGGWEPCFKSITLNLVIPFLIVMSLIHVVAAFPIERSTLNWIAISMTLAFGTPYFLWRFNAELKGHKPRTEATRTRLLAKYVITAEVAILLSVTSLLMIYSILGQNKKSPILLVLCTSVVVLSNLLVAVQFRREKTRAVITGILAAVVLLISGEFVDQGKAALSTRFMEKFGFGGDESVSSVTLVLTNPGREILVAHDLTDATHQAGNRWVVRDARILSRLGSEYFLKIRDRHIAIPKGMVVSWSTEASPGPPSATVP